MSKLYPAMGQRIAQLRHEHHLTQLQLSEKLDISVKHMSEIERGLIGLSLDKLVLLCDILCTSLDYIVRGKETESSSGNEFPTFFIELYQRSNNQQKHFIDAFFTAYQDLIS
mgnify:CR=1 FL=1